MTEALYMNYSYLKAWKAKIVSIKENKYLVLIELPFIPKVAVNRGLSILPILI